MSSKHSYVSVRPLQGGRADGGVCALLKIGDAKILLDCGCSSATDFDELLKTAETVRAVDGLDAVIISHADLHHVGALPLFLSSKRGNQPQRQQGTTPSTSISGTSAGSIPVICTLPVYKFSQIALYDFYLNKQMEGLEGSLHFDLDDVDHAFSDVVAVKFNQTISLPDKTSTGSNRNGKKLISVCALPSGRTIGGAIWRLRCGPTEILYAMDANLRKEIVLNGASLDSLPSSPALMIVEGSCVSRAASTSIGTGSSVHRGAGVGGGSRKSAKDESSTMISLVMETVRGGGNVLLPCETGGRALELLQILGKHWYEKRLGMYNLVFLSHMARNVPEFARMQLEWMGDSLARAFYNGKPNPFQLPQVKFLSSLRDLEMQCPGPKVVLATDASLSCGLSKELLLLWGGDPRCRVIFTDASDPGSLAVELRAKFPNPPVIAGISQPERVELSGEELARFQAEQERRRRQKEEEHQRKRLREELSHLNVGNVHLIEDEDDIGDSGAAQHGGAAQSGSAGAAAAKVGEGLGTDGDPGGFGASGTSSQLLKRRKLKSAISRFLEPNFLMFESKEVHLEVDEYGASIDDLKFRDIVTVESRWHSRDHARDGNLSEGVGGVGGGAESGAGGGSRGRGKGPAGTDSSDEDDDDGLDEDDEDEEEIPTKMVPSTTKVQFTCDFRAVNVSGRMDFKAVKTVTSRATPARLLVLRGSESDCAEMLRFARANKLEGWAPTNGQEVSFKVPAQQLRVQVPQSLLPSASLRPVKAFSATTGALVETKCAVTALRGVVAHITSSTAGSSAVAAAAAAEREGTKLVRYRGHVLEEGSENAEKGTTTSDTLGAPGLSAETGGAEIQVGAEREVEGEAQGQVEEPAEDKLDIQDPTIGVVSKGEVTLNSLRQLLEAGGTPVEFRIGGPAGAVLICGGQVVISKANDGDFVLEGPPVPAFYAARQALYQQCAFV